MKKYLLLLLPLGLFGQNTSLTVKKLTATEKITVAGTPFTGSYNDLSDKPTSFPTTLPIVGDTQTNAIKISTNTSHNNEGLIDLNLATYGTKGILINIEGAPTVYPFIVKHGADKLTVMMPNQQDDSAQGFYRWGASGLQVGNSDGLHSGWYAGGAYGANIMQLDNKGLLELKSGLKCANATTDINPTVNDGATAIAYRWGVTNNLTTTGALHSAWKNSSGTNLMTIDNNGNVISGTLTNGAKLSPTDGLQLFGTATQFEDENLDPTTLTGTGNAPTLGTFASTGIHIATFSATQLDEVEGKREIPHKTKLASDIVFHAHCYPTTTNTGNVRLGLEYFFSLEGVAVTTSNTIYIVFAASGTAWAKQSQNFAAITTPNELGSQLHFRFFRDGANVADTYTGALAISTIGFHYEIDSLGSRDITTK